jgi:hypothetical protein
MVKIERRRKLTPRELAQITSSRPVLGRVKPLQKGASNEAWEGRIIELDVSRSEHEKPKEQSPVNDAIRRAAGRDETADK